MPLESRSALSMPELVDNVLSQLESYELMHPALVCRLWAEIAREYIWRIVENSRKLFRILAPLDKADPLDFSRIPRPSHWQSFLRLSRCVRVLGLSIGVATHLGGISSNAIDIIFRTRSIVDLFPRLTRLCCLDLDPAANPERLLLLLAPNLRALDILVPVQSVRYSYDEIFEDIISRCPRLEDLTLRPAVKDCTLLDIQNGVCQVLQKLPLKNLTLPPYYLSTSLLLNAATCNTLRFVSVIISYNHIRLDDYRHAQNFTTPSLPLHSYPNLTLLELAAPIHVIMGMLSSSSLPLAQLTVFHVRAVQPETNADIRDFLALLRTQCNKLTDLALILARPHRLAVEDSEAWPETLQDEVLRFDALQHIRFPLLTNLEIIHDYALPLTDDELVALTANLPHLIYLQLNAAPAHPEPGQPALTLHALHRIAPKLPSLENLSLLVDATRTTGLDAADVKPFKALKYIFLCWSPIEKNTRQSVSRFLKRVLPTGATLDMDPEYVSSWDCGPFMFETTRTILGIWENVRLDVLSQVAD